MSVLIITVIFFITTVIAHIIIHRILMKFGIVTFTSTMIFIISFGVFAYLTSHSGLLSIDSDWRYSSIVLFILLSAVYVLIIASPFLGDIGPSARIVQLIQSQGSSTREQILVQFSNTALIDKRLEDLTRSGFTQTRNNKFYITPKGNTFITIVDMYKSLLGWKSVG